ncbi:putative uncharacterized protein encoded by LINC00575 [Gorilla gorilla gorilla]|uniref:putative uncharacterized protein encoded by LINC00575 n=1 Tax=Gorilla gorilla gorilla TaxID=9595 RepID=UPI002445ED93|nr:putative uncharacterized protein encoded by LINC00575 [Gorilla gorilla gorilla]
MQKEECGRTGLAKSSGLHLSSILNASCPRPWDFKFFSFWTLGLTPLIFRGLSVRQPQAEGCTISFPILLRFWDSDCLPGSSACRQPTVGLHHVTLCIYFLRKR